MTSNDIRLECLRLASMRTPGSNVVELAKEFEQYVTGDDAKFVAAVPTDTRAFVGSGGTVHVSTDGGPYLPQDLPSNPTIYADT